MIKKAIFLIVIVCLFFTGNIQVNAQGIENDDVVFEINPEIPNPSELVSIEVKSYAFDVNTYFFEWTEGNEIKLSGYGKKDFQFVTGKIGETRIVTLKLKREEGGAILYTKQFVSKPSGFDVLWQSVDTYTPPFYRGKALPSTESIVKIIALPNFQTSKKTVLPKDVVYTWKRDYETVGQASGYGKNTFSIKKSYLDDEENIEVIATEPTEGAVAKQSLLIKTYPPKIVFYRKDPLFGLNFSEGIISETTLNRSDTTLLAVPYFMSPKNILDTDLTYTWSLNGSEISTPAVKNQIVLRGTDAVGIAKLDLLIESMEKLFLSVTKTLTLNLQDHD